MKLLKIMIAGEISPEIDVRPAYPNGGPVHGASGARRRCKMRHLREAEMMFINNHGNKGNHFCKENSSAV